MARSKSQPIKLDEGTGDTITAANGEDTLVVVADDGADTMQATNGADTQSGGAIEETIESLRAQRDAANERAEREALARQNAERQMGNAASQVADSNLLAMTNAIDSFTEAKKGVTAKLKAAKESGDYEAEIAAIDELQVLNGKIARVTEGKNELERRIEESKEAQERFANASPAEQYIVGANLNGRAAQFIRNNPDLVETNGKIDNQKLANLNFAHAKAVRDGHTPGTDGYFESLEDELLNGGGEPDPEPQPRQQQQRQRPPAAPPSRQADPGLAQRNANLPAGVEQLADGRYRLSADRREAARISGLSDGEYLKNLLALNREGALH